MPCKQIFCSFCSVMLNQAKRVTMAEKLRRLYGFFKCEKCQREWGSCNSWKGMGQECHKCKIMIKPYNQEELKGGGNAKGPHEEKHCEMCQKLGYNCTEYSDTEEDYYNNEDDYYNNDDDDYNNDDDDYTSDSDGNDSNDDYYGYDPYDDYYGYDSNHS